MTMNIISVLTIFLLIIAYCFEATIAQVCWEKIKPCVIRASLHDGLNKTIDIACEFAQRQTSGDFVVPTETISAVTLNGCLAQEHISSYGFEALSACDRVVQITLNSFHSDHLLPLHCKNGFNVELLIVSNNMIAAVEHASLANLVKMRELRFSDNNIERFGHSTFESLPQLTVLQLENELRLTIKEEDAHIFQNTNITVLRLSRLQFAEVSLLKHLPVSLHSFHLSDTNLSKHEVVLINPQQLRNITIVNCALESFILEDLTGTVAYLNVSDNSLNTLDCGIAPIARCGIEVLDMSQNKLTQLNALWFRRMAVLRLLFLRDNHFKTLALETILPGAPQLALLDLRHAPLDRRNSFSNLYANAQQLSILVDNSWYCFLRLSLTTTEAQFRVFHYQKLSMKVNMQGLECQRAEVPAKESIEASSNVAEKSSIHAGHIERADFKRSQRAEALFLVFMLPLGIAVLFLLLYMWIYCQKVFHWSFYRSLPTMSKRNEVCDTDAGHTVRARPAATTLARRSSFQPYDMSQKGAITAYN